VTATEISDVRAAALDSGRSWLLVALGVVTVVGVALFYWGTAPESD